MSHIAGHYESNPLFDYVYPYYENDKGGQESWDPNKERFPILFINNRGIKHPENNEVGFHLLLIPVENLGSHDILTKFEGKYFGFGYDIVPWEDHRAVDEQARKDHGGRKIEQLTDTEIQDLSKKHFKLDKMKKNIADQTEAYKKTFSFGELYLHNKEKIKDPNSRVDWILNHVVPFKDISYLLKDLLNLKEPKYYV